ncbi:hypothetical protein [Actinosynnema sp. NPDC023587]|uniref:hypothetical protein n=1 Tax=Actinosynnema sp. NPDC023587 TaxID=3154695 RepID=UPI0033C7E2F4
MRALSVAIVGAGLIGMDLFHRIREDDGIRVGMVIGRSPGKRLDRLAADGYRVSERGLVKELDDGAEFDVVFDATDARSHVDHWARVRGTNALMVDLTPSHVGTPVVPVVNIDQVGRSGNISMVSCAGQASIPVLHALAARLGPDYVEVNATVASSSFGPGTRRNANEFVESTRDVIRELTGVPIAKFIAGVSPARPAPDFRLSVSLAGVRRPASDAELAALVESTQDTVRAYAPGYAARVVDNDGDVVTVDVRVRAVAPTLPGYAGNLEITNGAALQVVRLYRSLSRRGAESPAR